MQPGFVASISLAVAIVAGSCGSGKTGPAAAAGPPPGMPPVPVSVAVAVKEAVPTEIRAVGTVEPSSTVQVKSQIAGELFSARFTEGSQINKGDLLFEIDPRPYREALNQTEAGVARDTAQLRQAEATLGRDRAQLKNAEAEFERWTELLKEGIASRTQFDQVKTTADAQRESVRADEAAIESARASLESDRAAVSRAKLDLSYTEIRSPVAGRAGNLLVHPGNLVKVNDVALVVINRIEPAFVSFGVPEQYLGAIRARSARQKLPVEVSLDQEPGKVVRGFLTVVDNAVDASTGTIRLKAWFDNHDRLLWPGQFVNALLRLDTTAQTVIPAEAVQAGQQGQFVYVVKADQTVELRPVAPGATTLGKIAIAKGVNPGDTVVTDGQLRLFPGAKIHPVPASRIDDLKY